MRNRPEFEKLEKERPECILCEQMLTEALDETLATADRQWFDQHMATCATCGQMLVEAKQGAAWLDVLKMSAPEPSAGLFDRIMASTSEAAPIETVPVPEMEAALLTWTEPIADKVSAPVATAKVIPFRSRPVAAPFFRGISRVMFEPRLAMTAAMAFFSIALTMNLAGIHLDELHASDLRPENLRHSFFSVRASAVRSYDNLRVVQVVESRVDDLRENTDRQAADRQEEQDRQRSSPVAAPSSDPATPTQQDQNQTPAMPDRQESQPGVSEREQQPLSPAKSQRLFVQPLATALMGRPEGLS